MKIVIVLLLCLLSFPALADTGPPTQSPQINLPENALPVDCDGYFNLAVGVMLKINDRVYILVRDQGDVYLMDLETKTVIGKFEKNPLEKRWKKP